MHTSEYTDDELIEQIARGDWGVDAAAPRLDTVTRLVAQRQRRRRTTIGAGLAAGLVAAAATTAVLIGGPDTTPTSLEDLAAQTPTVTGPATARATNAPPRFPNCTSAHLLLSLGPYAGTPRRPTQTVFIQNIGKRTCTYAEHPVLSIGTRSGGNTPVDMTSAASGPWTLQPKEALAFAVTGPRPSSCVQKGGVQRARQFNYQLGDFTSTFNFPGMQIFNCGAPVLTGIRVGPPPPN